MISHTRGSFLRARIFDCHSRYTLLASSDSSYPSSALCHLYPPPKSPPKGARAALRTCAAPLAPSADPSLPWRLAPRHVTRTRATALLTKAAIDQQAWEDALRASRQLSVLYAPLYPPYHPALSLQLAQSAKLGAFLERYVHMHECSLNNLLNYVPCVVYVLRERPNSALP